jgi:hypothetical protein
MGEAYSMHGAEEECPQDLVGKSEGKRHVGRQRNRLEDNFREIEWGGMDWFIQPQDGTSGRIP